MWTYAWVVLPEHAPDLGSAVYAVMDEHYDEICVQFFQIGGPWTGIIDQPDPCEDPRNRKDSCRSCHGSGQITRSKDGTQTTCWRCGGHGKELKDPKDWVTPPQNVRSTRSLLADLESVMLPADIFTPHKSTRDWKLEFADPNLCEDQLDDWTAFLRKILNQFPDGEVVVIAYHS